MSAGLLSASFRGESSAVNPVSLAFILARVVTSTGFYLPFVLLLIEELLVPIARKSWHHGSTDLKCIVFKRC